MSSSPYVRPRAMRGWLLPLLLVGTAAGLAWWLFSPGGDEGGSAYRTDPVVRGDIRTAISATGTLSATATVEIGTQVSGILQSVEVDFNDVVSKDQVIARIDPSTFQARLEQASATLSSTRAGLLEAQAAARNAELDYQRKADLLKRQLIARSDADQALAARDQARARVASATAQVGQQQANVNSARLDLDKTIIRSPVDGVVLLRAVEPGQTVAASLQTPVLFKIAGDLRKMEIVLAIDEADIGQVREGQTARFTVDAFPDRRFSGKVKQVRLAATNTANVITYPVVVQVENPDLSLLPGMTANAEIEISLRPDVLSVANAALRFKPADTIGGGPPFGQSSANSGTGGQRSGAGAGMVDALAAIAGRLQLDEGQRAEFDRAAQSMRDRAQQMRGAGAGTSSGAERGQAGGRPANGGTGAGSADRARRMAERMALDFAEFRAMLSATQQASWDSGLATLTSGKRAPVYRLVDGKPEQVTVRIGASDGTRTELLDTELKEGDLVVVGSARPSS